MAATEFPRCVWDVDVHGDIHGFADVGFLRFVVAFSKGSGRRLRKCSGTSGDPFVVCGLFKFQFPENAVNGLSECGGHNEPVIEFSLVNGIQQL